MAEPQSPQVRAILANLLCPVCCEVMQPPIRQCENGHNLCGCCRERTRSCPICRGPFSPVRNLFAESAFELLVDKLPCKYSREGCMLELSRSEKTAHEKDACPFRHFDCPVQSSGALCGTWHVPQRLFETHMVETHRLYMVTNPFGNHHTKIEKKNVGVMLMKDPQCDPWILKIYGAVFVAMRHFTATHAYFWVLSNQPESKATHFSAKIKVSNKEKTKRESWHGPVHPICGKVNLEDSNAVFRIPLDIYTYIGQNRMDSDLSYKHLFEVFDNPNHSRSTMKETPVITIS